MAAHSYTANVTLGGSPVTTALVASLPNTQLVTDVTITTSSTADVLAQLQDATTSFFQAHLINTTPVEIHGFATNPVIHSGNAFNFVVPAGTGAVAVTVQTVDAPAGTI